MQDSVRGSGGSSSSGGVHRIKLTIGEDARQAVDVYLPRTTTPTKPCPLLVFIHGGAWVSESTEGFIDLAEYLADHAGVAVALPEYRLTTYKGPQRNDIWHPDHLQDVFDGLEKVFDQQTAQRLGYTTEGAVLVGHSAGGYMTLAVALDSAGETGGLIRSCPPLDARIRKSIKAFVCVESIFSLVDMLKQYPTYDYFTTPAFYPPDAARPKPPYSDLARAGPESWPLHAPGTYRGTPGNKPSIYVIHSRDDTLLNREYNQTGVRLLQDKGIDVRVDLDSFDGDHEDLLHTKRFWDLLASLVLQ